MEDYIMTMQNTKRSVVLAMMLVTSIVIPSIFTQPETVLNRVKSFAGNNKKRIAYAIAGTVLVTYGGYVGYNYYNNLGQDKFTQAIIDFTNSLFKKTSANNNQLASSIHQDVISDNQQLDSDISCNVELNNGTEENFLDISSEETKNKVLQYIPSVAAAGGVLYASGVNKNTIETVVPAHYTSHRIGSNQSYIKYNPETITRTIKKTIPLRSFLLAPCAFLGMDAVVKYFSNGRAA